MLYPTVVYIVNTIQTTRCATPCEQYMDLSLVRDGGRVYAAQVEWGQQVLQTVEKQGKNAGQLELECLSYEILLRGSIPSTVVRGLQLYSHYCTVAALYSELHIYNGQVFPLCLVSPDDFVPIQNALLFKIYHMLDCSCTSAWYCVAFVPRSSWDSGFRRNCGSPEWR